MPHTVRRRRPSTEAFPSSLAQTCRRYLSGGSLLYKSMPSEHQGINGRPQTTLNAISKATDNPSNNPPPLPRLRPRHPHRLHLPLPLSIPPLIHPRILPPPATPPLHPLPRPPPPKPAHRPQNPHARAAQNARRRDHERRATDHRPDSRAGNGSGQGAHGGVFGVAHEAPEEEDGDVAGAAEEGAGAQVGWLGAVGWVVEVFEGVGCAGQFAFVVVWCGDFGVWWSCWRCCSGHRCCRCFLVVVSGLNLFLFLFCFGVLAWKRFRSFV